MKKREPFRNGQTKAFETRLKSGRGLPNLPHEKRQPEGCLVHAFAGGQLSLRSFLIAASWATACANSACACA